MKWQNTSNEYIVMNILIVATGFAMQFLGAWGIDFAFLAAMANESCVYVPIVQRCVDLGDWWNSNFFFLFSLGAVLLVFGSFNLGTIVQKLRHSNKPVKK